MKVVIVSKTQMTNAVCVGGVLENGRFVRLLNERGYNQDTNTVFNIGEIYSITFNEKLHLKAPHVEDILVTSFHYENAFTSDEELINHLVNEIGVNVWRGSTEILFNGNLQWTSAGSGYIAESSNVPNNSVGFWLPDRNLVRKDYNNKVRYSYPPIRWRSITFVGFQNPVEVIPAGTLVRVSLARWWSPGEPGEDEERCYLQISGWYGLPDPGANAWLQEDIVEESRTEYQFDREDDLPF